MHTRDAWAVEPMKLADIKGDVQAAADVLRSRRYVKKQKASEQEANQLVKKAQGSGYQHQVAVSDNDFWFVCSFLHMPILT
jgi:hypothetical protein